MENSFFDREELKQTEAKARQIGACPAWLLSLLQILADNAELFPVEEDRERYTVEYIYPH